MATSAWPDLLESSLDVASTDTVPALLGVNTPLLVILPALLGTTDHNTSGLYAPLPFTTAAHVALWPVTMVDGEQVTTTDEIEGLPETALIVTPQDASERTAVKEKMLRSRRTFELHLAILKSSSEAELNTAQEFPRQ
jgi:hypothetical protein